MSYGLNQFPKQLRESMRIHDFKYILGLWKWLKDNLYHFWFVILNFSSMYQFIHDFFLFNDFTTFKSSFFLFIILYVYLISFYVFVSLTIYEMKIISYIIVFLSLSYFFQNEFLSNKVFKLHSTYVALMCVHNGNSLGTRKRFDSSKRSQVSAAALNE